MEHARGFGIYWFWLTVLISMHFKDGTSAGESCCACGTAKYSLRFTGKWTPIRHPTDHPGRLAAFTSLIGATHKKDFILWREGTTASVAMKKMAEGNWLPLKGELGLNKPKLLSEIMKIAELQRGTGNMDVPEFSADKNHQFLSVVSRMKPSPDWFVGVDSLNLCDKNTCTWKQKVDVDLFPMDAGTDSGINFQSPNAKTVPQQKIHRIGKHALHKQGSFRLNEGEDIPSLAEITIRLIRVDGCNKKGSIPAPVLKGPGNCKVTKWSHWSKCILFKPKATCGIGYKKRIRTVIKDSNFLPSACPKLLKIRSCHVKCKEGQRHRNKLRIDCKVSEWSKWSECSAETCGKHGLKIRTRNVTQFPGHKGKACPKLVRHRRCKLPDCSAVDQSDNARSKN